MSKLHVKKDDHVVVLAGKEKGKSGRIIAVLRKKSRVVVEGLQMIKKHTRKSQQNPNGVKTPQQLFEQLQRMRQGQQNQQQQPVQQDSPQQ